MLDGNFRGEQLRFVPRRAPPPPRHPRPDSLEPASRPHVPPSPPVGLWQRPSPSLPLAPPSSPTLASCAVSQHRRSFPRPLIARRALDGCTALHSFGQQGLERFRQAPQQAAHAHRHRPQQRARGGSVDPSLGVSVQRHDGPQEQQQGLAAVLLEHDQRIRRPALPRLPQRQLRLARVQLGDQLSAAHVRHGRRRPRPPAVRVGAHVVPPSRQRRRRLLRPHPRLVVDPRVHRLGRRRRRLHGPARSASAVDEHVDSRPRRQRERERQRLEGRALEHGEREGGGRQPEPRVRQGHGGPGTRRVGRAERGRRVDAQGLSQARRGAFPSFQSCSSPCWISRSHSVLRSSAPPPPPPPPPPPVPPSHAYPRTTPPSQARSPTSRAPRPACLAPACPSRRRRPSRAQARAASLRRAPPAATASSVARGASCSPCSLRRRRPRVRPRARRTTATRAGASRRTAPTPRRARAPTPVRPLSLLTMRTSARG